MIHYEPSISIESMKNKKEVCGMTVTIYVESKKMMKMNLYIKLKQTHRHKKQIFGYQRGKGERDKLGVWD